jgi:hypothetical protein
MSQSTGIDCRQQTFDTLAGRSSNSLRMRMHNNLAEFRRVARITPSEEGRPQAFPVTASSSHYLNPPPAIKVYA